MKSSKTLKVPKKRESTKNVTIKSGAQFLDSNENIKLTKHKSISIKKFSIINKAYFPNVHFDTYKNEEEEANNKELNLMPYTQAIKMDKRNCFQIFLAVLSNEIKIISIFYYRHPYAHLSIVLSQYIFELCLDFFLNSFLYTEDVISEKYNNNGSIRFFTTLSLSFISNIISSIIAYFLSKLAEYADYLEFILKDVYDKSRYYLNIIKFKKILCVKLTFFFIIQTLINLCMCYYLMIFCTVYHNTQGSIMINYATGIAESMAISFGLTLITSSMRAISIHCRFKSLYYTSKYFFENF